MKLPRSVSGIDLVRALSVLGYTITRQTGSHMRLTTLQRGEHHVTMPKHDPLRIGTLAAVLTDVGEHFGLGKAELIEKIFGMGRLGT